jgi:hypothetical protein
MKSGLKSTAGRTGRRVGARLVMRMELSPKGALRLVLPILGRFMHQQQERNLVAIKQALECPERNVNVRAWTSTLPTEARRGVNRGSTRPH